MGLSGVESVTFTLHGGSGTQVAANEMKSWVENGKDPRGTTCIIRPPTETSELDKHVAPHCPTSEGIQELFGEQHNSPQTVEPRLFSTKMTQSSTALSGVARCARCQCR